MPCSVMTLLMMYIFSTPVEFYITNGQSREKGSGGSKVFLTAKLIAGTRASDAKY